MMAMMLASTTHRIRCITLALALALYLTRTHMSKLECRRVTAASAAVWIAQLNIVLRGASNGHPGFTRTNMLSKCSIQRNYLVRIIYSDLSDHSSQKQSKEVVVGIVVSSRHLHRTTDRRTTMKKNQCSCAPHEVAELQASNHPMRFVFIHSSGSVRSSARMTFLSENSYSFDFIYGKCIVSTILLSLWCAELHCQRTMRGATLNLLVVCGVEAF